MYEGWIEDLLGFRKVLVDGESSVVEMPPRAALYLSGLGITVTDDPATKSTKVLFSLSEGVGGESIAYKTPARLATTGPITLSGLFPIDGVTPNEDDRILVLHQLDQAQNGLYGASSVAWERTADADDAAHFVGMMIVPVKQGDTQHDTLWGLVSDEPFVIGSSALNFAKVGSGDAESLRGKVLGAGTPDDDETWVYDTGTSTWNHAKIKDASIAVDAAIAVSKLAAGASGQFLKSVSGEASWSNITTADLGENLITAADIATDQNNYAPTSWATATIMRLRATGALRVLNGLAPATAKRKVLVNYGSFAIRLKHLGAGQSAGNQISTPAGLDFDLMPGAGVTLFYDQTSSLWRIADTQAWSRYDLVWNYIRAVDVLIDNALSISGALGVVGNITTTAGDLYASNGDVKVSVGGKFKYVTPITRNSFIPLHDCAPFVFNDAMTTGYKLFVDHIEMRGDGSNAGAVRFPIRLPHGAVLKGFVVGVVPDVHTLTAQVKKIVPSLATPTATAAADVGALYSSSGSAEQSIGSATALSETIDNGQYTYALDVSCGDANAFAKIFFVRLSWTDPGPINL